MLGEEVLDYNLRLPADFVFNEELGFFEQKTAAEQKRLEDQWLFVYIIGQ